MSELEFYILKISVSSFHEKYIESKTVTFFNIDITNIMSKKQWSLEKRFSDFKDMNDIIIQIHPTVPSLPALSLFKVTSFEELTKRRLELEEYLRECIKRKDILRSKYFQKFLEIDKNCPELIGNSVINISECSKLSFAAKDMIYIPDEQIMFVSISNSNVLSRVDSLFTNYTFFWETKTDSFISLGAVCVYNITIHTLGSGNNKEYGFGDGFNKEYEFNRIWTITFPQQIGPIYYEPKSSILSVALSDGKVALYKHNGIKQYIGYKEMFNSQIHNDTITGLAIDKELNCIYSCSMDKTFCVTDLNTKVSVPVGRSNFGYSNLKFDNKNDRLFITNEYGQVKVFLTTSSPPIEVILVRTSTLSYSKALTIDVINNYIFVGSQMGKICILNLGFPGKERFITEISAFGAETKLKLSAICHNSIKNELISGDEEGRVCVWSLKTGKLVFVWLAHPNSSVNQMYLEEDKQLLWTGGDDKTIRVWKFPKSWNSPQVDEFENNEIHVLAENLALARVQKAIMKSQESEEESDSSDDDLNGWEKD